MYVFGFYSAFSGQRMYEGLIYQAYNLTMTSLPIFFYCVFDFEYLKDEVIKRKNDKSAEAENLLN